jgi:hypothetical protein
LCCMVALNNRVSFGQRSKQKPCYPHP